MCSTLKILPKLMSIELMSFGRMMNISSGIDLLTITFEKYHIMTLSNMCISKLYIALNTIKIGNYFGENLKKLSRIHFGIN